MEAKGEETDLCWNELLEGVLEVRIILGNKVEVGGKILILLRERIKQVNSESETIMKTTGSFLGETYKEEAPFWVSR